MTQTSLRWFDWLMLLLVGACIVYFFGWHESSLIDAARYDRMQDSIAAKARYDRDR